MANRKHGDVAFFSSARVTCGHCGEVRVFSSATSKGDNMARIAGWQVEWRPTPFVNCPDCQRNSTNSQAGG